MAETLFERMQNLGSALGELGPEDVPRLWHQVTEPLGDLDRLSGAFAVQLDHALRPDGSGLGFGLGAWTLDLRTATAQALVCGVTITTVLAATGTGVASLPAAVLPTVAQVLFNVRAARLERDEEVLLVKLQRTLGEDGRPLSADALYRRLDHRTRRQVSFAQFEEFLAALLEAGRADGGSAGTYKIRSVKDQPFIRLTLH